MDRKRGSPFDATGRGWVNQSPHRVRANAANATAMLINQARPDAPNNQIYLFLNRIETGYSLGVSFGQGPRGRQVYPLNVTQDDIIATGQCVNQHEKDLLVQFVTKHHETTISGGKNGMGQPCTLILFGYKFDTGTLNKDGSRRYHVQFEPWKYDVYITDIDAGHERYKFAPDFTLRMAVANDYLQERVEIQADINDVLQKRYQQSLKSGGFISGANSTVQTVTVKPQSDDDIGNSGGPSFSDILSQEFPDVWNTTPHIDLPG